MNQTPKIAAHNWSAEPWQHLWKHDTHKVKRDRAGRMLDSITMNLDDYDRACECVNALAGIEDPAATLQNTFNALLEIARLGANLELFPDRQPEFNARCAKEIAMAAVKSLGPYYYGVTRVQEVALSPEEKP